MLKFKNIPIGGTNCFLILCNDGYLLIDTGQPEKYEEFIKKLKRENISITEIKYILLTHHHHDHSGNLNEIVKNSDAKVIIHEYDAPYIEKGDTKIPKGVNFCGKIVLWYFSKFVKVSFSPFILRDKDIIIDEEEYSLEDIGIDGKVIHTPGHTKGSISLILGDKAFIGDLAMNKISWCFAYPKPIFAEDINEVYKSWEKLIKKGVKTVYPGHGKCFDIKVIQRELKSRNLSKDY